MYRLLISSERALTSAPARCSTSFALPPLTWLRTRNGQVARFTRLLYG